MAYIVYANNYFHSFVYSNIFIFSFLFTPSMSVSEEQQNFSKQPEEEKKDHLKITLEGGQDFRTVVLAKPRTKVYKLLDAFCKEHKVDQKEYRLVYKDKVLHLDERIENYNIQGDATISVVASQVGGGL